MLHAITAQTRPHEVEVKVGHKYFWCACSRTQTPPYCDGSHSGTGKSPVLWIATRDETVYFCGCHKSSTPPFCDGTHNSLLGDTYNDR